ncbi:MAG: hypothetical protein WKF75_21100 [Singulisphaera sp.]
MPLFLDPWSYVNVPLKRPPPWRGVPRRWRDVLERGHEEAVENRPCTAIWPTWRPSSMTGTSASAPWIVTLRCSPHGHGRPARYRPRPPASGVHDQYAGMRTAAALPLRARSLA